MFFVLLISGMNVIGLKIIFIFILKGLTESIQELTTNLLSKVEA